MKQDISEKRMLRLGTWTPARMRNPFVATDRKVLSMVAAGERIFKKSS